MTEYNKRLVAAAEQAYRDFLKGYKPYSCFEDAYSNLPEAEKSFFDIGRMDATARLHLLEFLNPETK